MSQVSVATHNDKHDAKVVFLSSQSLGKILMDAGKITVDDCEQILGVQATTGQRFGEIAKDIGLIDEKDIQRALSTQFGFNYLASKESGLSPALIVAYEPFGPQAEAIRTVRSQLQQSWFNDTRKALAVVAHEGRIGSELVGNLAIACSQLGKRTLIIDANLRHPLQHELFNIDRTAGLAEILGGRAGADVIRPVSGFTTLSILPAGATTPPNPQELLSRPVFGSLIAELAAAYDVLLLDTAPLYDNIDACIVAARAGGVLVTARRDVTPLREMSTIKLAIAMSGAALVGAVMAE